MTKKISIGEDEIVKSLKQRAQSYAMTDAGQWLLDFKWWDVKVALRVLPPDVCGMYFFGVIYLMDCLEADAIFPTYIHELRHRWQRVTNPVTYYIGKIYRPIIEDDARRQEHLAEDWLAHTRASLKSEGDTEE